MTPTYIRSPIVEWLRARDKKRYGKWITHNTAKGGADELLAALDVAGFSVVPKLQEDEQ